MHEWGLACELVRQLEDHMETRGAESIEKVRVRIGSLSCVSPDAFRFAFDAASSGTSINPNVLEIRREVASSECLDCGFTFEDARGQSLCPRCESVAKVSTCGTDLILESLTLEVSNV